MIANTGARTTPELNIMALTAMSFYTIIRLLSTTQIVNSYTLTTVAMKLIQLNHGSTS